MTRLATPHNEQAKSDQPIESVRRICCDSSIMAVVENENKEPLNVGRKHRIVHPKLRKALTARDKCCRYPGLHTKWLDAQGLPRCIGYHVMHWVDGGETSLENTMLLCARHHGLLHEGGFSIKKNYKGAWYFETSQGKVISDEPVYQFPADEIGFDGISETRAKYSVISSLPSHIVAGAALTMLYGTGSPGECQLYSTIAGRT